MIIKYSTPHYAFDWIYFSTATGRKFLHYCDIVHKFSDDVIMQRRKELLEVQLLHAVILILLCYS